jgi:hypothetical protein
VSETVAIAIVAGAVAGKPLNGGESWVRLSWILGLRRLGFDVYFIERLDASKCTDRAGRPAPLASSANLAQLEHVEREFGLQGRVGLTGDRGERLHGLDGQAIEDIAAEAEVLFDLSGNLGTLAAAMPTTRVYVDLDPGFTQAWHLDPTLDFSLSGYDRYVTVGLNVGTSGCSIPGAGVEWIGTLPPVVLGEWSASPTRPDPFRFTTVATWRTAHGPIELGGRALGLKHHELRRLIGLPERVAGADFELALDIHPADAADREALEAHGWSVVCPRGLAATPDSFRDYVRSSSAEFSVAQPVYVETASGWFSDRTAAYLAAGRPALVQDTGIGARLPRGEGLLTFSTSREACERARQISSDALAHGQAARRLAETNLDSDLVLGRLLGELGIGG